MNRRRFLALLGLPALAALFGGAYATHTRGRNPYYEGPVSPHFDGVRFSDGRPVTKGFRDFLRWQWEGGRAVWPAAFEGGTVDSPPERVAGLRVTHLGHASFLVQAGGLNLVIDPVYSERASPFSFAGPRRVTPPGVPFEKLPRIDAILVTHNHYDHLDRPTILRIIERDGARVVTPLGNDRIINGGPEGPVPRGHDWGERVSLGETVAVTLVPAYHWSARGALDRRMALWASFVIETPAGRIYHVGDTGYHDGAFFRQHRVDHGPFRLALLPIGAYEPRWFMQDNHMNPDEAVQTLLDLGAEEALGHHWGTFQLTNEAVEAPRAALAVALASRGIPDRRFVAVQPGFVWQPPVG
jgi:L-ascorbate metabolism protein UlaG (beta-lactamase superfamily)